MDLLLKRRQMMAQGGVEKLDYLTIIPDEPCQVVIYPAYIETYNEEDDEYVVRHFDFQYSLDDGITWRTMSRFDLDEEGFANFHVTNTLKLKANFVRDNVGDNQRLYSMRIEIDQSYYTVSGSVMSLCYGDDFSSYTGELTWPMYRMFNSSNKLRRINTPKTFLSATSYKYADDSDFNGAYEMMFSGCNSLENTPEIHLVYIGMRCCSYMFSNCSALIEASAIHSQSVGYVGCQYMFNNCKSLIKAPNRLPATLLSGSCFVNMFSGCSSLEKAPELPAVTLVYNCYMYMFNSCRKLNYVKANFTTLPDESYTYNWMFNVSPTGTFVKNKDATWDVTGDSGIPSSWTIISE